ncbi:MAG: peptide MFS transporter [Prevotella sp.]|nr:peptide MFS transporter [Prevotella sp.]
MFEGQPKGLYALALANTGERFGYYTMLAIFTLYLQAKFGFSEQTTGAFYSSFLMMAYLTPLFGGMAADKWGYGKMVTIGIFIMFFGYVLMAVPFAANMLGIIAMSIALFFIACGTGLFKGNLQVMVGNLYENARYSGKRDGGFSIFYMAINIGALFAPTAATLVTNWIMTKGGFTYNSAIPQLAHQYLDSPTGMTAGATSQLHTLMIGQGINSYDPSVIASFCHRYIDSLSLSYNLGFSIACFSLILSFAIYYLFRNSFKNADYNSKTAAAAGVQEEELSKEETHQRVVALFLVFAVVIFFWMSFHQNGLTLTFFARDYTQQTVSGSERFAFDVTNLVSAILMVYGAFGIFQNRTVRGKLISAALIVLPLVYIIYNMGTTDSKISVLPQIFQQFNPSFVVALTPVSLAIFGYMASKKNEPSAPRKIAYGMLVAAIAYCLMTFASIGLPSPDALKAGALFSRVSPNWLISTYLVLTFGELLLSPMGISFVSKVAPPKLKGTMMGLWFVATAVGNMMVQITGWLWGSLPLWSVWIVLIVVCLLSFFVMMALMKRLERVC